MKREIEEGGEEIARKEEKINDCTMQIMKGKMVGKCLLIKSGSLKAIPPKS